MSFPRPAWSIALVAAVLLGAARPAAALPLFSRPTGEACSDCHSAGARLNAEGLAFAQAGFRIPGAPARLWSAHYVPLSVLATADLGESRAPVAAAGTPEISRTLRRKAIELHSAGALADRVSYHVAADWNRDEFIGGPAFVQLDDVLPAGALNLRAGRFDAELPFLSRARRVTMAGYLSPVTFDARGLELNGAREAWSYAAGLSESDRRFAGGQFPHPVRPQFEDTYLRLGRSIGAQAIAAQMLFDRQDSNLSTLTWLQHLRAQLGANLGTPRFNVIPSWVLERFDDRPLPNMHQRQQFYMLEALALLDRAGRWQLAGRFEHQYVTRNQVTPEGHQQAEALDLAWQARPATRLALEWARTDERLPRRTSGGELDAFVQAGW